MHCSFYGSCAPQDDYMCRPDLYPNWPKIVDMEPPGTIQGQYCESPKVVHNFCVSHRDPELAICNSGMSGRVQITHGQSAIINGGVQITKREDRWNAWIDRPLWRDTAYSDGGLAYCSYGIGENACAYCSCGQCNSYNLSHVLIH